ncbi:serine/threonine-protein kinase gad8 [Xylaria cf. heliscus]|nr:serine/threonine-protein kinase gad8 [Xylaria cf. heliscus]
MPLNLIKSKSRIADKGKDDKSTPLDSDALVQTPTVVTPKQGILVVTLYEAHGLSWPKEHLNAFSSERNGKSHPDELPTIRSEVPNKYMPYALLDFDRVQLYVDCIGGNLESPSWAGSSTQYKFDVSRVADLTIHLFTPNPNAPPGYERAQGISLGKVRLTPRFDSKQPPKTGSSNKGHKETPEASCVSWANIQQGSGQLRIGIEYMENETRKLSIADFELLKVIGQGSFGKVMQVRKRDTNCIYAVKSIRKEKIIARNEVTHTLNERSVLAQINNPFIVPLKFTFQSPEKLYFVLAFINGGELFHHLMKEQCFDINRSRFYACELLCAVECLHGFDVIYRDLKPENILLDNEGHIALCDFGLCKPRMKDDDRTNTFCGTPEYLAPEVIRGDGYNKTVDWWTLGVILWEMIAGLPPFYHENVPEMYNKILREPLHFPDSIPPAARDLLKRLLDRDPAKRLGANGSAEIKSHPFFEDIDWKTLMQRKYEPAFKPNVVDALDTTNFDTGFTSQSPQDSYVSGPALSLATQHQFAGFSYNGPATTLGNNAGSIEDI